MSLSNIINCLRRKKMQPYVFRPTISSSIPCTNMQAVESSIQTPNNTNIVNTHQNTNVPEETPDVIHVSATPYYKFSYLVREQSMRTLQKITPIRLVPKVEKKSLNDYDEIIVQSDDFGTFIGYEFCNDIPMEELIDQPAFLLDDYGPPPPYNACHGNPPLTNVRAVESKIPTPPYATKQPS